jgi:hypothetical protein
LGQDFQALAISIVGVVVLAGTVPQTAHCGHSRDGSSVPWHAIGWSVLGQDQLRRPSRIGNLRNRRALAVPWCSRSRERDPGLTWSE